VAESENALGRVYVVRVKRRSPQRAIRAGYELAG